MASSNGEALEQPRPSPDGDDAGLSGWLLQRGPTDRHKWRPRWCVLSANMLEIYEDEECQFHRASIPLYMSSRVAPFDDEHAPGESAKYTHERPYGFVLDADPDAAAGKLRRMQYFDTSNSSKLRLWTRTFRKNACLSQLAGFVVDSAGTLEKGDVLVVVEEFCTDSEEGLQLDVGDFGTVIQFDDDGDASIRFDGHQARQWVTRRNFHKLRKERAGVDKPVYLDIIPQSAVIMHWAIRVGSLDLVRCYEFECEGVLIGKRSNLHVGFPTQTLALEGKARQSHQEIEEFTLAWGSGNSFCVAGADTFGGKNCQDFAKELCQFLGLDVGQLPIRQAQQVKGALLGAGLAGVGGLAVGTEIGGVAAAAVGLVLTPEIAAVGAASLVIGAGVVAAKSLHDGEAPGMPQVPDWMPKVHHVGEVPSMPKVTEWMPQVPQVGGMWTFGEKAK